MAYNIPKVGEPRALAPKAVKPFIPPRPKTAVTASDFAAKSLLQQAKQTLDIGQAPVVMARWDAKTTGLVLDIEALLTLYPLPNTPDGKPFILKGWQVEDIGTLIQWDRVGAFLPVGSGKTVIATLVALAWADDIRVVVLPPILVKQWVKWLHSIDSAGNAVAYKGTVKERNAIDLSKSRWWVMSYGIFKNDMPRLTREAHGKSVALIVDEAQNIKNAKSKIFIACERFAAGQRLIEMSGTELNSPADAYAHIKIKTPGVYSSYGQFERIHVGKRDFFEKPLEWANLDLLNTNLYLQAVQRTKEEVHAHVPEARYMPLEYELDPKHLALYNKLCDEQVLELEGGGKVDGTTQQNLYNFSQQIILNWAHFADDPTVRPAAFDLIDSLIEQSSFGTQHGPKKFIVWTWFIESNDVVSAYLRSLYPGRVVQAYGPGDSQKAVDAFMEDPETWWLVANPGSAGAGLNPQYICYNSLFLEIPTRTIAFRQSAGRIDREGQTENANIWLAIASGTIQEHLYKNLLTNDALVQKVQGNPRDLRKIIHGG
jgi:hypothetical protein